VSNEGSGKSVMKKVLGALLVLIVPEFLSGRIHSRLSHSTVRTPNRIGLGYFVLLA
jgi:hypothetical protein